MENRMRLGRIGVLMGGVSSEREVSLKSGMAVYESLIPFVSEVVAIDIKTENQQENINLLKSHSIDCAFISLHGRFGEDGQIQGILENLKIPYTGSGVEASRLSMDKIASRQIFEAQGLRAPKYKVMQKGQRISDLRIAGCLSLPWVVKPATHGSSVGLSIVDKEEQLHKAVDLAFSLDERIIIEEYIRGRELTVGILDEQALPIIEIIPKRRFFDYQAKYQPGMTEYVLPAQLEHELVNKIQDAALVAHKSLNCYGCSRVDIILGSNIPYILEINTIPGFTLTSLLPKAARFVGIEFSQMCIRLILLAYEKAKIKIGH